MPNNLTHDNTVPPTLKAQCIAGAASTEANQDAAKQFGAQPHSHSKCAFQAYRVPVQQLDLMRQIEGDSWSLPQCSLLNTLILKEGEYTWRDGKDFESCFNLFDLPPSWWKHFAFSNQMAGSRPW